MSTLSRHPSLRPTALAGALLSFAACATCLPPAARAAEAADQQEPKGKFADMINQDRGSARYVRQEFGDVAESTNRYESVVKEDLVVAKQAFDAEAALHDR